MIIDSEDQRLLRQSVGKIAERYGHTYFADRARAGGRVDELWAELGEEASSACTCRRSTAVAEAAWPSTAWCWRSWRHTACRC